MTSIHRIHSLKLQWNVSIEAKILIGKHKNNLSPFSSVQSLSSVRFFQTPWTTGRQASLSITNSQSLPKLMSIEVVMPSNYLILCRSLLLLPSIFPNIRVFSNEAAPHIRSPDYWSFSFISPSNKHTGLISFRMDSLQSKGLSRVFSNTIVQKHQFFSTQLFIVQLSHPYMILEKPYHTSNLYQNSYLLTL